jgi:hypothetical protein
MLRGNSIREFVRFTSPVPRIFLTEKPIIDDDDDDD